MKALRNQVVLLAIDEVHTCLESQWGNKGMREDMSRAPAFLKAQFQTTTKAPALAMTASAQIHKTNKFSKNEVENIAITCSIHHSTFLTISLTPILPSQIFVRITKPPSYIGFDGIIAHSTNEKDKSGPVDILWKIYLEKFVRCIENGEKPKKAIIYVTNLDHLSDIHEFLLDKLGHLDHVKNLNTRPWVVNSTCAGRRLSYNCFFFY